MRSLALCLFLCITTAHATGTKPATPATSSTSSARADASSTSGADAVSSSTGGSVGDFHSRGGDLFVLPMQPFMPPMAPLPCPSAHIQQSDLGIAFGLFRYGQGTTDARDCTAITVINSLIDRCQYGRAQSALDLLAARALPGYKADPAVYPDLTPAQCASLKLPPAPPVPVSILTQPTCPAPLVAKPRPTRRAAVAPPAKCS